MTGIEFRVLGSVEILHDGHVQGPTTAQQRCVLAMLLLELGHVVPARRLVSALWASDPPASARNSLRVHVTRLRKLLAADPAVELVTVGEGWRLACDPERVDLQRFRALVARAREGRPEDAGSLLREGLSLWRGPALADVAGHWLTGAVGEGLEDERLAATEDRIAADLLSGDDQGAVPELSVLVAEHPLRERPAQLLMSALHHSGRTAEGLEVFQRTRKRLVEELGIEPGAALRDAHRRLLRGSEDADASDGATLPRQLPGDVAVFAGRAGHLAHLDDLLDRSEQDGTTLVATIAGIPGSGKTTLAVHWAHRVADRFPDGQLYLNLRGFDPAGQPVAPAEAVRALLDALGAPAGKIPTGLDAQAALFRSLVAGKRVLVMLDNARDTDQVRPLLPGTAGSAAVITGRNRLSGLIAQGAQSITLGQLAAEDAARFLTARLREQRTAVEPEATAQIIDACGGLPLALAIVAARAAAQPGFPLSTLAAGLRDAGARLDALADPDPAIDLRAAFSWSYRALSADTARMFRLLSVHPGPDVTAAAAASLAGIAPQRARRLLADLVQANLLIEQAPGRFSFHDLLHAYAGELADTVGAQDERDAATHRVLDHYLHTADAAIRLIDPALDGVPLPPLQSEVTPEPPADGATAMAWFAAEHAVLLSAVAHAAERGFDAHCRQLACVLPDYLYRRGYWQDLVGVWQIALEAARRLGDTDAQTRGHRILADAYAHLARFDDAHDLLQQALVLCRDLGDRTGQAQILQVRGRVWRRQGRLAEALDCNRRALALFTSAGHKTGQARALASIGWHHALVGEHGEALAYCERAMTIMQAVDDRSGQAAVWDSLGFIHCGLGEYGRAIVHYRRALVLLRELDSRSFEAETLANLGDAQHADGDHAAARRTWTEALALLKDLGHTDAEKVRVKLDKLAAPTDRDPAAGPGGDG